MYIMNKPIFLRLILLFIFIFLSMFIYSTHAQAETNDTMTVEANILGFGNESEIPEVGIEVPDYVFLGNVSRNDPLSDEKKIVINNTGKTNIIVTPRLRDEDEEIFQWLYFRTRMSSSNASLNIPYKIGDYSIVIKKPSSGKTKNDEYIYMRLNLTEFEGNLREDLIGYQKEIIFFAMSQ